MRGIVNKNQNNSWEIIFFQDNKIQYCPIKQSQLPILELRDNGEEIEFEIEKFRDKPYASIYSFKSEDKIKYWFNYKEGHLVNYKEGHLVIIYNHHTDVIDTMHIDYFLNEHINYDKISLKQFIWIFGVFTSNRYNYKINYTNYQPIFNEEDFKSNSNIKNTINNKIQIEIDPNTIFTSNNI